MKIKNVKLTIVPNKSSTYFLPILDSIIKFKFLDRLYNSYVINNEKEGCFSVLYKWSGKPEFTQWEEELMNNHLFVGHEDYDEYVLYKFRLPSMMKDALVLFCRGEYSKYSDEYKLFVKDFLLKRGFTNYDKIYKIMNLDENLRIQLEKERNETIMKGSELSPAPDMNSENFSKNVRFLSHKNKEFE